MTRFDKSMAIPIPPAGIEQWKKLIRALFATAIPSSVKTTSLFLLLSTSCSILHSGPPIGSLLPSIMAKNLYGQPQLVSPQLAPCILFFYSSSCHHCKRLLESILPYYRRKGGQKPKIFLFIQQGKTPSSAPFPLPGFPVLRVSSATWHNAFQVKRTPTLLFYDIHGRLLQKQLGWRAEGTQEKILNGFLREIQLQLTASLGCQPSPNTINPNPAVWTFHTKGGSKHENSEMLSTGTNHHAVDWSGQPRSNSQRSIASR